MIKVDADVGWVDGCVPVAVICVWLPVYLSVFLSFCLSVRPYLRSVRPSEKFWVGREFWQDPGKKRDRTWPRCLDAMQQDQEENARAVSGQCQCQRQCHIRFGLGLDR